MEATTASGLPMAAPFTARLGVDPVPAETLGGKGAALLRLVDAGFPVPETGVVTTESYRTAASGDRIRDLVARIAAGEVVAEETVDAGFAASSCDPAVMAAIADLAGTVGDGGLLAVRSSATVEDLHGSSFAGQYRSILNVESDDPAAVLTAVRRVWASLWYPAPSAYRQAFGIDDSDVAMAVVLMRMVPATTAGVVFTVDPGGSAGVRVEAVEGLGESLVSGAQTPAAWVVGREPERSSDRTELPPAAARALELSLDVERAFGVPQDVEWAAVDGEVFVVQARPITVLDTDDGFDTELDEHELTTAGIVEMVPGVLPPLRWEINRFLMEEAFRSVLDSLGIIRGTAAEERPFVRRVRGRVAIDFDRLRDAAADIPGAVQELEEQYFGSSDPAAEPGRSVEPGRSAEPEQGDVPPAQAPATPSPNRARSWWARLHRDLRTLRTRRHVIDQAEIVIRSSDGLSRRRPALEDMVDEQLLAYTRRLIDLAARGLAAELGVAASGAAAYRRLQLHLEAHLGSVEGRRAVQAVTAGGVASVERRPTASAAIFGGPTWSELESRAPDISVAPGSAEAEWRELRQRLRTLPGWTRRRILTGGITDVRMRLIKRLVTDVIEQLHRREAAKAAVLDLGGEVRRTTMELGRRFVERGILTRAEEIELLSPAEVIAATTAGEGPGGEVLRRRRNWLSRYEAEGVLPVRFVGVPDRQPAPLPDGELLRGWAASPGRRRGRARVVRSSNGRLDEGEILVAEATDASWSPLFLRAGAVVVERGGPLSHAAILARELGLPAVLNVVGAASVLDRRVVSVDGDQGLVVVESEAGT